MEVIKGDTRSLDYSSSGAAIYNDVLNVFTCTCES